MSGATSSAREEALVTSRLESIFSKHGAVQVKTPLLLPKSLPVVDSRVMQFDQVSCSECCTDIFVIENAQPKSRTEGVARENYGSD